MTRFQTFISYLLLGVNALLLFCLGFQEKLTVPSWLLLVGRMHPLLLHLPIGLLVFVAIFWFFRKEFEANIFQKVFSFVLSITALSAALAALMGMFLSKEGGYTASLLDKHTYTGVGLSLLCYGLWWGYRYAEKYGLLYKISLVGCMVLMGFTGHFGASLTHGEDYLFPSKNVENQPVVTDKTPIFEATIQPILKAKCYQCHNEQKTKGDLLMTNLAGLLKGGKNGPIWVAGQALNSHIIQRANLPLEHKEHMPPKGKPQLTPQEIALFTAWINAGADTKKAIGSLSANDSLKKLIQPFLTQTQKPQIVEKVYPFDAVSDEKIMGLNNPFRAVFPIANNSPALQADFFVRSEYKPEQLSELSSVKTQLVGLNLSNMPIADQDLKTIAQFENLEKLILNNTNITGGTLTELKNLKSLESLGLSGTKINANALDILAQLPHLEQIYLWNTALAAKDIEGFQKQNKKIKLELGFVPNESEILKLNKPTLVNETYVLDAKTPAITFKHSLKGVQIRYTTDGTEPDTTKASIYEKPLTFATDHTTIKALATKDKWYASDRVEYTFFNSKFTPNNVELLTEPNPIYKGEGSKSLTDRRKGSPDEYKSAEWVGYQGTPFEALFSFDKAVGVKTVTLSLGKKVSAWVMPPTSVELWAGTDKANLKLVQKVSPKAARKDDPNGILPIKLDVENPENKVFKVIARPLMKLPDWHSGKGKPAHVMIDEVFFN